MKFRNKACRQQKRVRAVPVPRTLSSASQLVLLHGCKQDLFCARHIPGEQLGFRLALW